jgi:hypothetical protein
LSKQMETFQLEKYLWTENDFSSMDWHDSKIYAIAFDEEKFELAFDIDYILQWIDPTGEDNYFKFWVAPATLVFKNVYDINLGMDSLDFQIDVINRSNPAKPVNAEYLNVDVEYNWTIETTSGEISFKSIGYTLFIRQPPRLLNVQTIGLKDRGGICFTNPI